MRKLIKYLKLFGLFRNVQDTYKEEKGKDRPKYLSRKFIGAIAILAGAVLSIHFGVKIDENILVNITDSLDKIVSSCLVLYGLVQGLVSVLKRKKK